MLDYKVELMKQPRQTSSLFNITNRNSEGLHVKVM